MWFLSQLFTDGLLQKHPCSAMTSVDWLLCRDVTNTRHGLVVMYVISRFLRIFMHAEKQACKQLQCNKPKLLEPASINGLHNSRF